MTPALDILCVVGSPRLPSRTMALTCAMAGGLADGGACCRIWNLACRPVLGGAVARPPATAETFDFVRAVGAADAVVLASPVYHNSFSGLLKAALDELDGELRRKPVALMSSAAAGRSPQALDHLRLVARALGAVVVPGQVVSRAIDHAGPECEHQLREPVVVERVSALAEELLWLARLVADAPPLCAAGPPGARSKESVQ
jgi:azobenzene reductase